MSTDEFDIDSSHRKKRQGYQTVLIPFQVENNTLIPYVISMIKRLPDISERLPIGTADYIIPLMEGIGNIGVPLCKLIQYCFADDDPKQGINITSDGGE